MDYLKKQSMPEQSFTYRGQEVEQEVEQESSTRRAKLNKMKPLAATSFSFSAAMTDRIQSVAEVFTPLNLFTQNSL